MAAPNREQILPLLANMQLELDNWYATSQAELNLFQRKVNDRIERVRSNQGPNGIAAGQRGTGTPSWEEAAASKVPSTPPPPQRQQRNADGGANEISDADWTALGLGVGDGRGPSTPPAMQGGHRDAMSGMMTPTGSPQSSDRMPLELLLSRISASSNAPPLNFDTLYEQLAGDSPNADANAGDGAIKPPVNQSVPMESIMHIQGQTQTRATQLSRDAGHGRPTVVSNDGIAASEDDPKKYSIDPASPCQALVEFKRKRVLQYDSRQYVAPGEYVVVGGDRGEDLGLVIYTWCETTEGKVQGIGLTGSSLTRSIGVGSGKVLRVATPFEVSQLHGIQTELERRAIDVCQQRVLDHGLPMVIVDAEYQFDNKKLTFFYEAQQRLDFRELVRDLFKTFRARIWMELAARD